MTRSQVINHRSLRGTPLHYRQRIAELVASEVDFPAAVVIADGEAAARCGAPGRAPDGMGFAQACWWLAGYRDQMQELNRAPVR